MAMDQRKAILYAHHRLTKAGEIVKRLIERVDQLEEERDQLRAQLDGMMDLYEALHARLATVEAQVLHADRPAPATEQAAEEAAV